MVIKRAVEAFGLSFIFMGKNERRVFSVLPVDVEVKGYSWVRCDIAQFVEIFGSSFSWFVLEMRFGEFEKRWN